MTDWLMGQGEGLAVGLVLGIVLVYVRLAYVRIKHAGRKLRKDLGW